MVFLKETKIFQPGIPWSKLLTCSKPIYPIFRVVETSGRRAPRRVSDPVKRSKSHGRALDGVSRQNSCPILQTDQSGKVRNTKKSRLTGLMYKKLYRNRKKECYLLITMSNKRVVYLLKTDIIGTLL